MLYLRHIRFRQEYTFEPACRHGKTHRGKNCDRQRGYYKTAGGKDGSLQAETHRIYFPVLQSAAIYDCSGKYSAASHVPGVWEKGERSQGRPAFKNGGPWGAPQPLSLTDVRRTAAARGNCKGFCRKPGCDLCG